MVFVFVGFIRAFLLTLCPSISSTPRGPPGPPDPLDPFDPLACPTVFSPSPILFFTSLFTSSSPARN